MCWFFPFQPARLHFFPFFMASIASPKFILSMGRYAASNTALGLKLSYPSG